MPKKKSHNEIVEEVKKVFPNIVIIGNYVNSDTPLPVHCNVCGYDWTPRPYNLFKSKGCPCCNGVHNTLKTTEEFKKEMAIVNPDIVILGEYIHGKKPIWVKCAKCNYEWGPRPNNLLFNHGCPNCIKIQKDDMKKNNEMREKIKKQQRLEKMRLAKEEKVRREEEQKKIREQQRLEKERLAKEEKARKEEERKRIREQQRLEKERREKEEKAKREERKRIREQQRFEKEQQAKEERVKREELKRLQRQQRIEEQIIKENTKKDALYAHIKNPDNALSVKCPLLAHEWNNEKNAPLTPEKVAYQSSYYAWWTCRFGHEYRCRVSDRAIHGTGCKTCAKRYRISLREHTFYYYIKKYFPDAIQSYMPAFLDRKEIDIYIPSLLTGIEYDGEYYHSINRDQNKDAVCSKNGVILIRIREPMCPVYERIDPVVSLNGLNSNALQVGVLKLLYLLSSSQKYDINIDRDRNDILSSFYDVAIPGSLAEKYPNIAKEWDYELNGNIKPENVPATKSNESYHWRCVKCGYQWRCSLSSRINGSNCPACSPNPTIFIKGVNDLATASKKISSEWHPTKNGSIKPEDVCKSSSKRVWWLCNSCGNEWQCSVVCRTSKHSGCRKCSNRAKFDKMQKHVFQYTKDGKYVREYKSIKDAADACGVSTTALSVACRKENASCAGYQWRYNKYEYVLPYYKNSKASPVYMYSLEGAFIQSFNSAKEASVKLNISENHIRSACTSNKKYYCGNLWSYEKKESLPPVKVRIPKKVYKYSLDGDFIQEYESANYAAKEYSVHPVSIQGACSGKILTCSGFQWRYDKYDKIAAANTKRHKKKVLKCDLDYNVLQIYDNAQIAANEHGVTARSIYDACCGNTSICAGFRWKYED